MRKRICVITGNRAEYGLLYWLLRELNEDDEIDLQIVVTGAHLSPEFGLTYKQIIEDGFNINEKIEMILSSDSSVGITKSVGLGIIGFADSFYRLQPDLVVVLGDRYEILAAAQAALFANIPIVHIHGGEITEGAIDDSIRHAVTKMAHIHFVSDEIYRKRVIQLGENPANVFNVGAIGTDNIVRMPFLSREELSDSIDFPLEDKFFLVTYHPETIDKNDVDIPVKNIFKALDKFKDYKIIFTYANSDAGGRQVNELIDKYIDGNTHRAISFKSLGQLRYLSAMKYCSAVIGNSSSGIIEAPILCKPTVNIGVRQAGRIRKPSVIDCDVNSYDIEAAIKKAISPQFKSLINNKILEHADGMIANKIKTIIKNFKLDDILKKKFYDLK